MHHTRKKQIGRHTTRWKDSIEICRVWAESGAVEVVMGRTKWMTDIQNYSGDQR